MQFDFILQPDKYNHKIYMGGYKYVQYIYILFINLTINAIFLFHSKTAFLFFGDCYTLEINQFKSRTYISYSHKPTIRRPFIGQYWKDLSI